VTVRIVAGVIVGQVGFALHFDQNVCPGEQSQHPGDDLVQHCLHCSVGRCPNFDKQRLTVGTASGNTVQNQASNQVCRRLRHPAGTGDWTLSLSDREVEMARVS
jgi:hypothetical protein